MHSVMSNGRYALADCALKSCSARLQPPQIMASPVSRFMINMITANMVSRATVGSPPEPSMTAHTAATSMVIAEMVKISVPTGSPNRSASASACAIARNEQVRMHATSHKLQRSPAPVEGSPDGDQCAITATPVISPITMGNSRRSVVQWMRRIACIAVIVQVQLAGLKSRNRKNTAATRQMPAYRKFTVSRSFM